VGDVDVDLDLDLDVVLDGDDDVDVDAARVDARSLALLATVAAAGRTGLHAELPATRCLSACYRVPRARR